MAPSSMFSKLRPGHAKRNASSLSSPEPVSSSPVPSPAPSHDYLSSPRPLDAASLASSSPVSPYPPQLPPIPRVASKLERSGNSSLLSPQSAADHGRREHTEGLRSPSFHAQEQVSPGLDGRRPPSATSFKSQTQSLAHVVEQAVQADTQSRASVVSSAQSEKPQSGAARPAPPTKSKSRLNIRNPMSILMRRRSGQTLDPLADESLVTIRSPNNIPPVPDNYDPSIRGRIVHDFSAPRPNRNFSYNNAYAEEQTRADPSPPKIERSHTPVFREHFDDETSYEQTQANIRAEQLANNDFLKRNSYVPPPPPARTPPLPPPAPKASPAVSSPPSKAAVPSPPPAEPLHDFASSVLSPVEEMPDPSTPTSPRSATSPRARKSAKTPPSSRSRAASVNDPSFTPAGLPSHLTSRASRFSFQIADPDSAAQEKILEDRHKEKEAEKASKQVRISTATMDDEYDEYGMDDFDMDGGYEEEIPMLGEEEEYAGLGDQTMSPGMAAFDFSSLSLPLNNINSMSSMGMMGGTQTPRDDNGNPIGFATSGHNQQQAMHGFGLTNMAQPSNDPVGFTPVETPDEIKIPAKKELALDAGLDDDLYFDDGMIEEQGNTNAVAFDEDMFDDPNGPLFERKVKQPSVSASGPASQPMLHSGSETGYEADDDTLSKHLEKSAPTLAHKTSVAQQRGIPEFGNLDAYHGALADAANRAEADGRFSRKASVDGRQSSLYDDDSSSISNSRPSLVPDDGRFSQETTGFPPDDDPYGMSSSFVDDYDYSDYDSALEDDPMIAAANAEALANDYEGFYGSEFGFYASQGEQPNAFGGVFGPSRTLSGRNIVREPSLTPITERSEYSTRNSFISIRGSQQLTSPGLAQLARLSPYGWPREDEDMSLDSLLKVRKATFGGSASGSREGSPRTSSPMGMQFLPRSSPPTGGRMHEQNGSAVESEQEPGDTEESDDEGLVNAANGVSSDEYSDSNLDDLNGYDHEDRPDSPTLTASDYASISSPTSHLPLSPLPPMPLYSPPAVPVRLPTGFPVALPLPSPNIMQPLKSPSAVPLPNSPPSQAQLPPLTLSTAFSQNSTQSPTFHTPSTATTPSAPRRPSLGLVSPSSTTSPVTPSATTATVGPPGTPGWKSAHHTHHGHGPGHSRKSSAADRDSVTYVREHDEEGGERWVLERRRTAESGELELVGRSIVEGGTI
ncbi:unnamed protein product [Periconia digitata]|uniref:Uncharacterized protein n=1 Tax=Periconia digitata TaxID=1303443 RepID=A0A9W4XMD4_9PLEO|nr:unnamed protein product [Periconia digitata]